VNQATECELCRNAGGEVLWENADNRVVWAGQPDHPGFCRVIAKRHVKEMTDLDPPTQVHTMRVVLAVEEALRALLCPDKVNLASFGNVVPHLHWHVIPRFSDDPHFPNAVWGERLRNGPGRPLPPEFAQRMRAALRERLED
jgi:diadenosine tetraphosphate (Ap4A) HIT family hydrolase